MSERTIQWITSGIIKIKCQWVTEGMNKRMTVCEKGKPLNVFTFDIRVTHDRSLSTALSLVGLMELNNHYRHLELKWIFYILPFYLYNYLHLQYCAKVLVSLLFFNISQNASHVFFKSPWVLQSLAAFSPIFSQVPDHWTRNHSSTRKMVHPRIK